MTITTMLKTRDEELRRLETNRDKIVRELASRLERAKLTATFDGRTTRTLTLADVLDWRAWSDFDIAQMSRLVTGDLRRFSTSDPNGNLCDLEMAT